jgi:hypothetical protein
MRAAKYDRRVGIATVEAPVDETEPAVAQKDDDKSDDYVDGMSE